jgi:hypothetical protein
MAKAQSRRIFRSIPEFRIKMKKIYRKGVAYP